MKVIVAENSSHAFSEAANKIINHLTNENTNSIGLATGSTMVPVYRALTQISKTIVY